MVVDDRRDHADTATRPLYDDGRVRLYCGEPGAVLLQLAAQRLRADVCLLATPRPDPMPLRWLAGAVAGVTSALWFGLARENAPQVCMELALADWELDTAAVCGEQAIDRGGVHESHEMVRLWRHVDDRRPMIIEPPLGPWVSPRKPVRWPVESPSTACALLQATREQPGTVLDPAAGLCATGLAAALLGWRAVLIEPDPELAELGARRLSQQVIDDDVVADTGR